MSKIKPLKIAGQFSGVGAFDHAFKRLNLPYLNVYQAEWDKHARQTYLLNNESPEYYVEDVYDTPIEEITEKHGSMDVFMSSTPCFTGETLVNTEDGFKQIKDIQVGDFVLTHENRFKKVVDFGSKVAETFILKAQGIIDTETTSNHRYYVRKRHHEYGRINGKTFYTRKFTNPEWVEVKDLTKDHFIGINIPSIESNPFLISKEVAYVLGRYIADGWLRIQKTGNSVIIAVGKSKRESISEKIKLKHTLHQEINGCSKLFIYSNSLVDLIQKIGLGRGAINKRIPQSIINLPKEILKEFVNGYMDGDGHKHKDFFRATSVSKELLMGLQLCIAKLYRTNANIKFVKTLNKKEIQGRIVNQKDYYVLEFRTEMRKQSNAIVIDDVIWYPIREIKKTNNQEKVYDLTVECDHSFTANQAIVHNCQSFSMMGKRQGKDDEKGRGILFFQSLKFIGINKPRFFIFENVEGLVSHEKTDKNAEYGRTFSEWVNYLGGKSVNGAPTLFPYPGAVNYHLHYEILNAKEHGIPQNRKRIFLVGVRDDKDNDFYFPKTEHLQIKLKDVLEKDIPEKYYLSERMIKGFITHAKRQKENGTGFGFKPTYGDKCASAVTTKCGTRPTDDYIIDLDVRVGTWRTHKDGQGFREVMDGNCPTIPARAREDGSGQPVIVQKSENYSMDLFSDEEKSIDKTDIIYLLQNGYRIRRLTPRECFRLMNFDDSFIWNCSDSQAFKQAGNSIVVRKLEKILRILLKKTISEISNND
jgi:DNA (cytosine-5)-methyltransferase 1